MKGLILSIYLQPHDPIGKATKQSIEVRSKGELGNCLVPILP